MVHSEAAVEGALPQKCYFYLMKGLKTLYYYGSIFYNVDVLPNDSGDKKPSANVQNGKKPSLIKKILFIFIVYGIKCEKPRLFQRFLPNNTPKFNTFIIPSFSSKV